MVKKALLIVDMQNDFCRKEGALFSAKNLEVIPEIKKEIEKARKEKIKIIFTQDWHDKNDREFKIWPRHCLKNSWGAEIIEELEPKKEDIIIKKQSYSAFFETNLDGVLKSLKIKTLIFSGCVTNICILFTAFAAFERGYEIILKKNCLVYVNKKDHQFALNLMKLAFKVNSV